MSEWTALFPQGTKVHLDGTSWAVVGGGAEAARVTREIERGVEMGWPNLEGWTLDRSPGFDPEWMYLRLLAIGAVEVEGPCPPCEVEIDVDDDDLVVG